MDRPNIWKIGPALLVGVLACALSWAVWYRLHSPDPVYEGRPLSLWLEGHLASSSANPPYGSAGWKKADDVLRQAGTNALPTLLRMIAAKDPPRPLLLTMDWLRLKGIVSTGLRRASARNDEAVYAFEVLGETAAPAVPDLVRLYQGELSPYARTCVAEALGGIGRPAQAAVPVLLRDFHSTNDAVRFQAVSAVMRIGGDPDVLLPAFMAMLQDPKNEVRWNAVVGISLFGTRARSLAPALQALLIGPGQIMDPGLRGQVETALWRIAPETTPLALLVETNSPLAETPVTREALDITFQGERRTLIPSGTAVPCMMQLWNSAPRGVLTLWRKGLSPGAGHRLGAFELEGLPPATDDINVSLLCIITPGTIHLAARDNTAEKFLPIRRVTQPVQE